MKKVWKEFFRLKYEEIRDFITDDIPQILILIISSGYAGAVIISILFLTGFVLLSAVGTPYELDILKTIQLGFLIIITVVIVLALIKIIIIIPIKWLWSNWKEAKKNVERRNEYETDETAEKAN